MSHVTSIDRTLSRSPIIATLWSLFLPGAGQIYCRQDNKGIFLLGMALLGYWATAGVTSLVLCPLCAWDAWLIAAKSNRGEAVQRWEFFPGIRILNKIPPRIILMVIITFIATAIVLYVVHFATTYHPND